MITKVRNTTLLVYVISDHNDEKIVEIFYEKELQKTNQKKFIVKKKSKEQVMNYILNGKIILLIVGLIK